MQVKDEINPMNLEKSDNNPEIWQIVKSGTLHFIISERTVIIKEMEKQSKLIKVDIVSITKSYKE